jgi:hypothetical protein
VNVIVPVASEACELYFRAAALAVGIDKRKKRGGSPFLKKIQAYAEAEYKMIGIKNHSLEGRASENLVVLLCRWRNITGTAYKYQSQG